MKYQEEGRKRVEEMKKRHEESSVLRYLVLNDSTARSNQRSRNTITKKEYSRNETLERVKILQGSNAKYIGDDAFRDCTSLQSIQIDAGTVRTIGDSAFRDCTSLRSVHLPDDLQSIGVEAFDGCSSLQSIQLPAGLTIIRDKQLFAVVHHWNKLTYQMVWNVLDHMPLNVVNSNQLIFHMT